MEVISSLETCLDLEAYYDISCTFLSLINLPTLLRLARVNRRLRNFVRRTWKLLLPRLPWRISVDYSIDFLTPHVTLGWTNFLDEEITPEAVDYDHEVRSVSWSGVGGNIARELLKARGFVFVNLDPQNRPVGVNDRSKLGLESTVKLGHRTCPLLESRVLLKEVNTFANRGRKLLVYSVDSYQQFVGLAYQDLSKKSRKAFVSQGKAYKRAKLLHISY